MLKQRVLTALLLLPLVLAAIFLLPSHWFMVLLIFILMIGSAEYRRLAGLSDHIAGVPMIVLQGLILVVLFKFRAEILC